MKPSLRSLLQGIVDYAGLFPPAALDMAGAVARYRSYLDHRHAWVLGRFVVPVGRLAEFEKAQQRLARDARSTVRKLSVIVGSDSAGALDAVRTFNDRHVAGADGCSFVIDAVEFKGPDRRAIDQSSAMVPDSVSAFYEIPVDPDPRELIAAISTVGGHAKVRTGGVRQDDFPDGAHLVRFMERCLRQGVAFKATAGLHHALPATYPFTYEADSAKGKMHGFLNLFLASAFLFTGLAPNEVAPILEESSSAAFTFSDGGISWRSYHVTNTDIVRNRRQFALSFGSCSFEEPVDELKGINLL